MYVGGMNKEYRMTKKIYKGFVKAEKRTDRNLQII